jgi:hypothetical protein
MLFGEIVGRLSPRMQPISRNAPLRHSDSRIALSCIFGGQLADNEAKFGHVRIIAQSGGQ